MFELIFFIGVVVVFFALLIWMEYENYKIDKKIREYVLIDKDGIVSLDLSKPRVRQKVADVAETFKDIK
jgi:peroxiredoxin